jgi:hypothetical protein
MTSGDGSEISARLTKQMPHPARLERAGPLHHGSALGVQLPTDAGQHQCTYAGSPARSPHEMKFVERLSV